MNVFSFDRGPRSAEAVARIVSANLVQITPQRWKAPYGTTADKIEARSLAQRLTGDQKRFRPGKDATHREPACGRSTAR